MTNCTLSLTASLNSVLLPGTVSIKLSRTFQNNAAGSKKLVLQENITMRVKEISISHAFLDNLKEYKCAQDKSAHVNSLACVNSAYKAIRCHAFSQ